MYFICRNDEALEIGLLFAIKIVTLATELEMPITANTGFCISSKRGELLMHSIRKGTKTRR